jgi:predicted enzyme related to lactoylglutathione lyase
MTTPTTKLAILGLALVGGSAPISANAGSEPAKVFTPVDSLPRFAAPHFNFVTLVVADPARALKFYTQALGMKERGRAQPNKQFAEIVVGNDMAPLAAGLSLTYRNGPPTPRGNGSSSINLVVLDLAGILTRVAAEGGKILKPLMRSDMPSVSYSIALIQDPDGNTLELVEYHRIGKQ